MKKGSGQSTLVRKKKLVALIDHLMAVAAVVHPLTALPQVYDIYATKNIEGVSLLTWFGFMMLGTIFLAYGVVHKIKPLIVTQILWSIVDLVIVIGIVLYSES